MGGWVGSCSIVIHENKNGDVYSAVLIQIFTAFVYSRNEYKYCIYILF